ncbi:MAG: nicotinate-nucleotide pyrophosphorylase [Gammaproteobacteria bacterium]|jgi:nicotinate-nucleotide pyrophosphorylase (carboxylating)|nr:nicotinate-nucleotide pyrophosphorylase [Gammaproteobacteria bacterium]
MIPESIINKMVKAALEEDIGSGDITAQLISQNTSAKARIITREPMILCGSAWVNEVFKQIDPQVEIHWHYQDGQFIQANDAIFELNGNARSLLTGERTALNFLQMLSGTATTVHSYVEKIRHTSCKLLDTRKTIPGFRLAQKYAVTCGGGHNHRIGLYDAFLIKENHIAACGSISEAIKRAREIGKAKPVEVEVENLDQLQEAIQAEADIVMLDNFNLDQMKQAVELNQGRVKLEVSGNVTLSNIAKIAETGVSFISVGSLTKHIQAIDLSMRFI